MGAISGVVRWGSAGDADANRRCQSDLRRVNAVLASLGARGPQVVAESSAALSFHSTAPDSIESGSVEHDSERRLTIVGDIRLDDRNGLGRELGIDAEQQKSLSDSALVLKAWQRWEFECPDHINGDFAFAIWDESRRQLFAARDLAGVRPFFYHTDGKQFVFASDLPAVAAVEGVPWELRHPEPDEDGRQQDPALTPYTTIRRLPQHHALVINEDGIRTFAWWSRERVPKIRYDNDVEYTEHFRSVFDESIKSRLHAAGPIATHVSGGITSGSMSAVASGLAREQNQQMLFLHDLQHCDVDSLPPGDERARVQAFSLREGRSCLHAEPLTPFGAAWTRIRHAGDRSAGLQLREPLARRAASQNGAHVILTGLGGRGLASYSGTFDQALYDGEPLRWLKNFHQYAKLRNRSTIGAIRFWSHLGRIPRRLRKLRRGQFRNPAFARATAKLDLWQPESPFRPSQARYQTSFWQQYIARPKNSVSDVHHRRLCGADLVSALEGWTINGWQEQIEYRHPLLDRRLLEFAMGVPGWLFMHQGQPNWLMRQAVQDVLPDAWGKFGKPGMKQDRTRLNAEYDQEVMRPLFTQLFAENWNWQCLNPQSVQKVMSHAGDAGSWWGTPLDALRYEMFLDPQLNDSIHSRLAEWEQEKSVAGHQFLRSAA